jgi:Bacterial extracellular solute-binding protein
MGRHRSPSRAGARRGLPWLAVAAALAVVIGSTSGALLLVDRRHTSDAGLVTTTAGCDRQLRVVAAASISPALAALAPSLASGPGCVRLRITVADGLPAARTLQDVGADLWIPDDAAWVATAHPGELAKRDVAGYGTVVATSPIYLVAGPVTAAALQRAGGSWLALARLAGAGVGPRLVVRDPDEAGDGLVAAGDLAESVWLDEGMDASAGALSDALRYTRTVSGAGPALPRGAGEVGLVPEYALLPALAKDHRLVVLPGTDHQGLLRYSFLPTAAAAADPGRAAALARLLAALTGPAGRRALDAAGLRPPGGGAPSTAPTGRLPAAAAKPFDVLAPHHVEHVFAAWYPEDRRTSVLLVIDVSASMAAAAPGGGAALIDLVRQGCRTVAGLLPDDSYVGMWEFGSLLDPPRDYRSVLPLARLGTAHRASLSRAVDALAPQHTGTGLYDTIVAAYRSAVAGYRPGLPNQVLVFTDSRNGDDPGGITPGAMSAALAAAAKPDRPVFLTVVSFGPKSRVEPLRTALAPVGGYVEAAASPDEVRDSFVHVAASGLTQR